VCEEVKISDPEYMHRCRSTTNIFFSTEHLHLQCLCNIPSDERMGLLFTIAAGPHQRSHSQIPIPRDS
jgi:hypothetical protein